MNVHVDWRLRRGIASPTNFAVLLAVLLFFPLVLRWTGALSVGEINPQSPQHTRAFLKFCFVLTAFLWVCFAIALVGIRRGGKMTFQELVGAKWSRWQTITGDLSVALATLAVMAVIGNHFYQGWIRLVPVFLIGVVVTIVALWRKSLIPGMIAHGFGDGLVAFLFFAKLLQKEESWSRLHPH